MTSVINDGVMLNDRFSAIELVQIITLLDLGVILRSLNGSVTALAGLD